MKFTKKLMLYSAAWLICIFAFNVIAFILPDKLIYEHTGHFWLGYSIITISFLTQLIISIPYYNHESNEARFLRIPNMLLSFSSLITSTAVSCVFISLQKLPLWLGVVIAIFITVFYIVMILLSETAADHVESVGNKVKAQTNYIKTLTVSMDGLVNRATSAEMESALHKVHEALRYSDPMSSQALSGVEIQMQNCFNAMSNAVYQNDLQMVIATSNDMLTLINDRNNICKLSK